MIMQVNFVWIIFGLIGLSTAATSGTIVFTPIPLYSSIQMPFKVANVQTCMVDGKVAIFLNDPGNMVVGLESNRGAINEIFRDQTLDQSDVVFGCNKYSSEYYNYVYLSNGGLYTITNGLKESIVGTYTKLIRVTSANDIWAIAKGEFDTYNWLLIRDTINQMSQTTVTAGEYFAVHSIYNHASIASIKTINYTTDAIEYYTYDMDSNVMQELSGEAYLGLNVNPNPILLELQRNWVCATDLAGYVTRLITVSPLSSAQLYDYYEGAEFLDVAVLGANSDIAVVALGTSAYRTTYIIAVYIWNMDGSSKDLIGEFILGIRNLDVTPDPANLRDFLSVVRLDENTAQLTYVLDGRLYGHLISLNGSVSNDLVSNGIVTIDTNVVVSTLILTFNSSIIMQEGSLIQVNGCASFGGTLVLILSNETIGALSNTSVTINIAQYACYDSEFASIGLERDPDLQDCEKVITKPSYMPSLLSVTVSVERSQCNQINGAPTVAANISGINETALITGLVVGGCVLVVGVLLLAFYFSPLRQKVFPYARKNPPQ